MLPLCAFMVGYRVIFPLCCERSRCVRHNIFLDSLFVTMKLAKIICSSEYIIDVIVPLLKDIFEAI